MFRYFRKIRSALLNENQFRKYLMYAIGEIFLVVIGILIALQINNWNNERLNHIEEQLLLESIASKMEFNQFQQTTGEQRYQEVIDASTRLLEMMNMPPDDQNVLEIEQHLHSLTKRFLVGKSNKVSIYDEMIGSGQLVLISSDALREQITILKENLLLLESYEEIQVGYVENQLITYLNKNADIISIYANGSVSKTSSYDQNLSIEFSTFYEEEKNRSYANIMNDQEFANLLFDLMQHTKPLFPVYKRLGENIEFISSQAKDLIQDD